MDIFVWMREPRNSQLVREYHGLSDSLSVIGLQIFFSSQKEKKIQTLQNQKIMGLIAFSKIT